ncbi:MAG: hypothetical protein ACJAT7_002836, partial [Psychromonas sp.]
MKKIIIISVIMVAIAAFFAFDLGSFLSLENIKASQADIAQWQADNTFIA